MIRLKDIVESIEPPVYVKEGGKLFGPRAQRVTTAEMNTIFTDLKNTIGNKFDKFKLSKALPSKADHGDIDIVVSGNTDIQNTLKDLLGDSMVEYSKNGDIHSVLYRNDTLNKIVHVDLISTPADEFDTQYDYLAYNDFSGILGIISRKLNFNYGTRGFFKIYNDKNKRNHYILITKNLREGLVILGYKDVLPKFDQIQNTQDVIDFLGSSDLFDSEYLKSFGMNSSDRKRSRSERPTARAIRDGLLALNKSRKIEDENYFLRTEYPNYYNNLLKEIDKINNQVIVKSKYGGDWLMKNFPEVKPGPIISKIKMFWKSIYGDNIDNVPEDELLSKTREFLKNTQQ